MKVIDLLNKIANGDEIPEKIKYENYIYWYDKNWKDYKNAQVEFRSYLINSRYHNPDFLNDEVEIIEDTPKENKKIEKISLDDYVEFTTSGDMQRIDYMFNKNTSTFVDKLNEIIDKVNGEK